MRAIFAAPGNAGTATHGENWAVAATDGKALLERAQRAIDLRVLGPETAIAAGVGDRLRDGGIATFGPGRSGGRLSRARSLPNALWIATAFRRRARSSCVRSSRRARRSKSGRGACVIKADGLAAGKGVVVAPDVLSAAAVSPTGTAAKRSPAAETTCCSKSGSSGARSACSRSATAARCPIAAACDYKRAGEGDTGPNTGGMGAYSPPAHFPAGWLDVVRERIIAPVLRGLLAEGETYIGVLYCGLMWTDDGPYVIEFNVRFGDPETQVIVPRVNGDLAQLLLSAAQGALEIDAATFGHDACVGVTIATNDYPVRSTPLRGLRPAFALPERTAVFWGASTRNGDLVDVAGGRVLTVTGLGSTVARARDRAYAAVDAVAGTLGTTAELNFRRDIAAGIA